MASKVDGIIEQITAQNGSSTVTHAIASTAYGYCTESAAEPNKTVDMTGFVLKDGITVHIKFQHANTALSPTLNINSTGAKDISFGTTTIIDIDNNIVGWRAGDVVVFTYDEDSTSWIVNNSAYATRAGSILSGNIHPTLSKAYPAYTCTASNQAKGVLFFGKITITNSTPWQTPWAIHYRIYVSTSESQTQGWYDCYFSVQGSTVTYYNYNNFYSTDYRPIYNHRLLYPKSGYSSYGAYFGVRVYDARSSTTLARTFKVEVFETQNCTVTLNNDIKRFDEVYVTTNNIGADTIWNNTDYNATSVGLQESGDANSNDTSTTYERYGNTRLTCTTIYPRYTLAFTHPTDSSKIIPVNTTENTTATSKTTITSAEFNIFEKIYYKSSAPSTVLAANSLVAVGDLWYAYSALNLRYSFNLSDTSLVAHKDVYLVCNLVTPTTATLRGYDQTGDDASILSNNKGPITQTLPSEDDGLIYIKLGRSYSAYQITLTADHPIYWYKNGAVRLYSGDAATVNGLTVQTAVPENAIFTDHYAWGDITGKPSSFTPSAHTHYELATIGDNRNDNTTPNTYSNRIIFQGLKYNNKINSPYTDNYSYLVGLRGWNDSTGGNAHELAFSGNGIYRRQGATDTWGNWFHLLDSGNTTAPSSVPTLSWGNESTVFTLNGTAVKIKAMAKPTYTYSDVGAASSGHAHGNITNDGKITSTATIANGDRLVIVDSDTTAGSKITGSSITFGSTTTTFLNNKGEWATPAGTYSLPLAADGTRGGVQIGYSANGKNYPVQLSNEKMYVNVPWTDTNTKLDQTLDSSSTDTFPLLFSDNKTTVTTATINSSAKRNNNIYIKPSTGQLNSTEFVVDAHARLAYNSTIKSLDFILI